MTVLLVGGLVIGLVVTIGDCGFLDGWAGHCVVGGFDLCWLLCVGYYWYCRGWWVVLGVALPSWCFVVFIVLGLRCSLVLWFSVNLLCVVGC